MHDDAPHDPTPVPIPLGFGVESDRWHLSRSESGALVICDVTSGGMLGVGSRMDLAELANLLLIGSDVLDGAPAVEAATRVDFVASSGQPGVVFSIFGQPPRKGESITLPDGIEAHVLHVRRDYRINGASKVTVTVEIASAA